MNLAHPDNTARRTLRTWRAAACAAALGACVCGAASAQDAQPAPTTRRAAADTEAANTGSILRSAPKDGTLRLMSNRSLVIKTRVPFKNVSISQPEVADVS